MNNLEKDFVKYPEALALKELGFDEACLGYFDGLKQLHFCAFENMSDKGFVSAPIYSQCFRWFREKHNLKSCIMFRTSMEDNEEYYDWLIKGQEVVYRHFKTYEEAEKECLIKLIEIVKNNYGSTII
jgi:hypothetical protein